jgi:hypothetical protein
MAMQAHRLPTHLFEFRRVLALTWLTGVALGAVLALIVIVGLVANLGGADFALPRPLGRIVLWGLPITAAISILCRLVWLLLDARQKPKSRTSA